MPEIAQNIFSWSESQPPWQRDALRRLFTAGTLSSTDIDELVAVCKSGHGLASAPPAKYLQLDHLRSRTTSASDPVSLISLTHHNGVNALAKEQTVAFGAKLTVVFGENGAGKSGYSRILKQACRSRKVEEILGNVLGSGAPLRGAATLVLREGAKERPVMWTAGQAADASLSQVSVFDSQCVPIYLGDKTDVAFRPFDLDVFDKLASACSEIRKRLELSVTALRSVSLPAIPGIVVGTKVQTLLASLSSLTREEDLKTLALLSPAEQAELTNLRTLRHELLASDPKKRASELIAKAGRLERLAQHLRDLHSKTGPSAIGVLLGLRERLMTARLLVDQLIATTLTDDVLPRTGGAEWKLLWSAAATFSKLGSTDVAETWFIRGGRCPLCQQEIGGDSAARLAHFEEFVRSTSQAELRSAQDAFDTLWQVVIEANVSPSDILPIVAEAAADDAAFQGRIDRYCETVSETIAEVVKLKDGAPGTIPTKALDESIAVDLAALASEIRERAKQLQASSGNLTVKQQNDLDELESRVALSSNIESVVNEIERRRKIAAFSQCIEETGTHSITKKSTELTHLLVTEQLKNAFQIELKAIGFKHLAVSIQPAGGAKGEHFHRLEFSNAPNVKVTSVLSEGESRTLSLAAFLTELSTASSRSSIIFDDPVSSLDHRWRERIGKRLVEVAKERQVIVFTHDLVFLKLLTSESERQAVDIKHQLIRSDGETGLCSADLPWVGMNVGARLGVLRNRLQTASATLRSKGAAEYEEAGSHIFGLLREAWEDAVSEVLLNDVIERYRPSIETNRVARLHDITEEDCKAVEEGMTACSRWLTGHLQAAADGTPFPEPDEIKARIDDLDNWASNIKRRRQKKGKPQFAGA